MDSESTIAAERVERLYGELRAIAAGVLASWRSRQTLNATALVHEAWLRLAREEGIGERDRAAFLATAAISVRRVLVDHWRKRMAGMRDGEQVPLFDSIVLVPGPPVDLLALDESLEALAAVEPRKARVVELRFFGGLGEQEVADALGVSVRTVSSDWRFARAWLARRLRGEAGA